MSMRNRRIPRQESQQEERNNSVDPSVLLDMKREIEGKHAEVNSLKGSRDTLTAQLSERIGCKTVDEAKAVIGKKKKSIGIKQDERDRGIEKLMADYKWETV